MHLFSLVCVFVVYLCVCVCFAYIIFFLLQIAKDEKDSILASIPADLREKGSTLYTSLIDGKVHKGTLAESLACVMI